MLYGTTEILKLFGLPVTRPSVLEEDGNDRSLEEEIKIKAGQARGTAKYMASMDSPSRKSVKPWPVGFYNWRKETNQLT